MSKTAENKRNAPSLVARLVAPIFISIVALGLFFGGFGIWAVTAPIAGAAVAIGTVSPQNLRRIVQHYEGGVIAKIHVADGETVQEGQVLIELDQTKAKAAFEKQKQLIAMLKASQMRLQTEIDIYTQRMTQGTLELSEELKKSAAEDQSIKMQISLEVARFDSRMGSLRSNLDILQQTIKGYKVEISGLQNELVSVREQLRILKKGYELVAPLREKGLELESRVLDMLRTIAQTEQQVSERESRISKLEETIKYTDLQIGDLWASHLDDATSEMASVNQELIGAIETILPYKDTLERTIIRAPVSGSLISLSVNTIGEVIASGQTLVEIVASGDSLSLEIHINPNDIDVVKEGQEVAITLLAYPQRNLPKLHSVLRSISPDSLMDELTGEQYFLGKIDLSNDELAIMEDDVKLVPGMDVQVMIQTSSRTFFDYVMSPIIQSVALAFREQ